MKTQETVWESNDGRTSIVRVKGVTFALMHNGVQVMAPRSWRAVVNYAWAEFGILH